MIIGASQQFKSLAITTLVLSMVINLVNCRAVDHCYSDIGCFPLSPQFYHPRYRPFNVRPWHRSRIKTQFELFNRHHPEGYILRPWERLNLLGSGFNPLLETKIIIPGWLDNIRRALWVRRLKDSLLWLWNPVNIIVVHWRNFTPYTIATANTRVVGAELANLLKSIEHELNYDRSYYHLIGHSLGAHISGYCGDRIPGLGRITALDPARPFFQGMPKSVRLDRGDAKFVDAIHSDFTPENAIFLIMSFGMTTPVGHVDFYPNGPPLLQPGCLRDTLFSVQNGIMRGLEHSSLSIAFLEAVRYLTACDHQRSHEWFIESITNRQCVFVGVRCNDFEGLINGRCTCDNSPSACAIMGIHADQMYLNNAHEDIWPLNSRVKQSTPSIPPTSAAHHHRPSITKEQVYSELKYHIDQLRRPPVPNLVPDEMFHGFDDINDVDFVNYLRSNILIKSRMHRQQPHLPPMEVANSPRIDPRQDNDLDIPLFNHTTTNFYPHLNEHPKLLSDFDRDVERWYEDSSRWYLKTNNRPNYCVNQYQVLVFIGPLKTTTGHHNIRANLIISIIGSRGQLLNQRFVPRSTNLDSFTMQPFFILLEGSYSLGNILSVAIGWEARLEPDPIQATISFQSNILEDIQSFMPTYNAKHPWLSETIKYDHSGAFMWRKPEHNDGGLLHHFRRKRSNELTTINTVVERRSGGGHSVEFLPSHSSEAPARCRARTLLETYDLSPLESRLNAQQHHQLLHSGKSNLIDIGDYDYEEEDQLAADRSMLEPKFVSENDIAAEASQAELHKANDITANGGFFEPLHTSENQITAKLHNIGIHLDRDLEDSIVVSQVIVSPLHATYGKDAIKVGKTFCPPRPGYRLLRDRTVRLVANLAGKCHYNPNRPIKV